MGDDGRPSMAQALDSMRPRTAPDAEAFMRVQLISDAKAKGLSWAAIASALGEPSPQAAKAAAKRYARIAQRAVIERQLKEQS